MDIETKDENRIIPVQETRQIQVRESPTPEMLISQAIAHGMDVDKLDRLFTMQERYNAQKAKEAYFEALANFQAECPIIEKDSQAKFETRNGGKADYKYAEIGSIVRQIGGILGKNGLSYSFAVEETPKGAKVTCKLTHKLGHSEESSFTADMAGTSLMSNAQVAASRVTFAKRYALCGVTGIVTEETDDDGNRGASEEKKPAKATDEQRKKIHEMGELAKMTDAEVAQRFRELYHSSFSEMTTVQADGVITMLNKKINAQKV